MIEIKKFTFNPIQENTLVLYDDSKECIIIDAGCYFDEEKKELDDFIADKGLMPVLLVNTHCHFDHIMGIEYCRSKYNIKFLAPKGETALIENAVTQGDLFGIPMEPIDAPDEEIGDGDEIKFGNSSLKVISAEGHSPGGLVFYNEEQAFLIAGDVLFYGSIGRTDLPGGSFEQLVNNIKTKLLCLPPETKVYSGHGPESSIGFEKENNPFLMD